MANHSKFRAADVDDDAKRTTPSTTIPAPALSKSLATKTALPRAITTVVFAALKPVAAATFAEPRIAYLVTCVHRALAALALCIDATASPYPPPIRLPLKRDISLGSTPPSDVARSGLTPLSRPAANAPATALYVSATTSNIAYTCTMLHSARPRSRRASRFARSTSRSVDSFAPTIASASSGDASASAVDARAESASGAKTELTDIAIDALARALRRARGRRVRSNTMDDRRTNTFERLGRRAGRRRRSIGGVWMMIQRALGVAPIEPSRRGAQSSSSSSSSSSSRRARCGFGGASRTRRAVLTHATATTAAATASAGLGTV